jgi:hypothetical protein
MANPTYWLIDLAAIAMASALVMLMTIIFTIEITEFVRRRR